MTNDALIAITASSDADVLVTNDEKLTKAAEAKIVVWDFERFQTHLAALEAEDAGPPAP